MADPITSGGCVHDPLAGVQHIVCREDDVAVVRAVLAIDKCCHNHATLRC